MVKYEIVRMPTDEKEMSELLEEYTPFLDAMYSEDDVAIFGELNFLLDYWLFLWDSGSGFFLTKRNKSGDLLLLAMLTKYNDIWHSRPRLEIHRVSLAGVEGVDAGKELDDVIEYLISVSSLLGFDFLYKNSRDASGNEFKELVWTS